MQILTSQSLRALLTFSQKRDALLAELAEIDSAIVAALASPTPAPVVAVVELKTALPLETKTRAKRRGKPASGARIKSATPGKNDDRLMQEMVAALETAGEDGLTIPEIAAKLNVSESAIDTLIRPFAKSDKRS